MTEAETGVTEAYEREFLESLARAVLSWQFVEHNLFLTFTAMMQARDHHLVSAAYHSVVNLRSKLEMIDAVAQIALAGSELLAEWETLRKCVGKRSQHRNQLVHSSLMGHFEADDTISLRIAPSIFDSRLKRHDERDIANIREFEKLFDDLTQRLDAFGKRVAFELPR